MWLPGQCGNQKMTLCVNKSIYMFTVSSIECYCQIHRHGSELPPPIFNFLLAYLFSIKFLYYFISFSFIHGVRVHISIPSYSNNNLYMPALYTIVIVRVITLACRKHSILILNYNPSIVTEAPFSLDNNIGSLACDP